MVPFQVIESRVRQRLGGQQVPGTVYEEELDVRPGKDVLSFYIRWRGPFFRRTFVAVHHYRRRTVTTEPVLVVEMDDPSVAWLDQLLGEVPTPSELAPDWSQVNAWMQRSQAAS